jgi:hypothetical protein
LSTVEENFSEDGEQWLVFHVFTAGGKPPTEKKGLFSFVFHSVLRGFWVVFRSRFVVWLCQMAMKKTPFGG